MLMFTVKLKTLVRNKFLESEDFALFDLQRDVRFFFWGEINISKALFTFFISVIPTNIKLFNPLVVML